MKLGRSWWLPRFKIVVMDNVAYEREHWEGVAKYILLLPNQTKPIECPFQVLITVCEGVYIWRITSLN